MKTKLALLFLSAALSPALARPSIYVEPRVSYLHIPGTPNIGDIGFVRSSDRDELAPSLHLGWQIVPRIGVEVRYTDLGKLTLEKTSPIWSIFPPSGITVPALRNYRYTQETDAWSLAVPIKLIDAKKLTVNFAPLLQRADAKIELLEEFLINPAALAANPVDLTVPPLWIRRHETPVRAGAELSAAYEIGPRAALTFHYTYLPLPGFDAHLFGAGVNLRF